MNYMLRVEREWSIMMEGEWAGNDSQQHRKQWAEKVKLLGCYQANMPLAGA